MALSSFIALASNAQPPPDMAALQSSKRSGCHLHGLIMLQVCARPCQAYDSHPRGACVVSEGLQRTQIQTIHLPLKSVSDLQSRDSILHDSVHFARSCIQKQAQSPGALFRMAKSCPEPQPKALLEGMQKSQSCLAAVSLSFVYIQKPSFKPCTSCFLLLWPERFRRNTLTGKSRADLPDLTLRRFKHPILFG